MNNKAWLWIIMVIVTSLLIAGCATPTNAPQATQVTKTTPEVQSATEPPVTPQTAQPGLANPASENCIRQGGTLMIETRGDEGQYGICFFEDNQQCEEWALLNGDCPVGGLKVTGYITPAAQYCAITGGTYTITGNNGAEDELGTCELPNGAVCDVWDYYNGVCTSEAVPTGNWQWYVSQEVGYALEVPSTWSEQTLPDQNDGNIHGMTYTGAEGGVEVYWGVGFGGACPTGTQPVQLAAGEAQACYAKQDNGTEVWSQIGYEVPEGNTFSVKAYTGDAQPSSHDLVLQVLSTLAFRVPTTTILQPLSMEVCDGEAQAMSHELDDLIPTQSEELMSDPVNDAWGTGCRATITGTGITFESPIVVVEQLGSMLESQDYTEDLGLAADGPTGTSKGYRNGDQVCLVGAGWEPDASANCPKDQPISSCQVTPAQQIYTATLDCGKETPAEGAAVRPASLTELGDVAG